MERIEDHEIRQLWVEHYPKRNDSVASKTVCLILFYIIVDRAQVKFPRGELSDKLQRACQLFGVPKEQFYEVGKDADDD